MNWGELKKLEPREGQEPVSEKEEPERKMSVFEPIPELKVEKRRPSELVFVAFCKVISNKTKETINIVRRAGWPNGLRSCMRS